MKTASADLIDLLAVGEYRMADLYTITLADGTVLRYTGADRALSVASHTWQPVVIKRSRTRLVLGIEVDSMDLTLYPDAALTLAGLPFVQACHAGALDGADVLVERAFFERWPDPTGGAIKTGVAHLFEGSVAGVDLDGLEIGIKVVSYLERLNIKMPRNLYQAPCANALYDGHCAVSKLAHEVSGSVASGSTRGVIQSALGQATGWFDMGTITFTSGANNGVSRSVKAFAGGQFTLSVPLAITPALGDTFDAYPGCDQTLTTCASKFSNTARFRGMPWIPIPETAY